MEQEKNGKHEETTLNDNAEAWNTPLDGARREALEQLCAALDLPRPDDAQLDRMTDFFHEAGMLRHTPRSGYAFLGSGAENVAEHSFRTAVMGYACSACFTICTRPAPATSITSITAMTPAAPERPLTTPSGVPALRRIWAASGRNGRNAKARRPPLPTTPISWI